MCGIAGVLNVGFGVNTSKFIDDALVTSMVRGVDSAGMFQVDSKGKIYLHKEAVDALTFKYDKMTRQFVKDTEKSRATVLHVRAATQGKITLNNAHPFTVYKNGVSPLVGVHNGSLNNWSTKPDGKQFEVDSKWALHHIAQNGGAAFKDIHGPFAFVWAEDGVRDKVFMARNNDRPLHLLFTKGRRSMLFASEAGMLAWLAERNRLDVEDAILVMSPGKLYTFDTSGHQVTYTTADLQKPTYQPMIVDKVKDVTPHHVGTGNAAPLAPATEKRTGDLNNAGKKFIDNLKLAGAGKLCDEPAAVDRIEEKKALLLDQAAIDKVVGEIIGPLEEESDIAQQRDDDAPNFLDEEEDGNDLVPKAWYTEEQSDGVETKMAKDMGIHRELHWFSGVIHDEDSDETLGEIELYSRATGKIAYTAVIRGCSMARANSQYIDNGAKGRTSGDWVVVTGAYRDSKFGTVFVCSELNNHGREMMAEQSKQRKTH